MKTLAKVPFELVIVEGYIPEKLEPNKFYYSEQYETAIHICPCGCGEEKPISIKEGQWTITDRIKLTVTPSLFHTHNCKSHYVITNGFANMLNVPIPRKRWNESIYDTHAPGGCPM